MLGTIAHQFSLIASGIFSQLAGPESFPYDFRMKNKLFLCKIIKQEMVVEETRPTTPYKSFSGLSSKKTVSVGSIECNFSLCHAECFRAEIQQVKHSSSIDNMYVETLFRSW